MNSGGQTEARAQLERHLVKHICLKGIKNPPGQQTVVVLYTGKHSIERVNNFFMVK
jgi:hypothetical protein